MWQRFTERARLVILLAQQEAEQTLSLSVEPEHLLIGIIATTDTIPAQIFADAGVTKASVQQELERAKSSEPSIPEIRLSSPDIEELRAIFQVDAELIRRIEEQLLRKLHSQSNKPDLKLSPKAKQVLELSAEESRLTQRQAKHDSYIGTEHLLLALLRQEDTIATKVLNDAGLDLEKTRSLVVEQLQRRQNEAA